MPWPSIDGRLHSKRKTGLAVTEKELPEPPASTPSGNKTSRLVRRVGTIVWLWELTSLILGIVCLAAIAIILLNYQGKPTPTWSYGLTVNGVISVLAGLTKACMILPVAAAISQLKWSWFWKQSQPVLDFERYDEASRGPWGSLMMLLRPRLWRGVGILGAAVTVAAIGLEPFLQQIPTYPVRSMVANTALLQRSTNFSEYTVDFTGSSLNLQLKGAVYAGVFNAGNGSDAIYTPSCPTGNCTYPAHSSLGLCTACTNVTALLQQPRNPLEMWTLPDNGQASLSKEDFAFYMVDELADGKSLKYRGVADHTLADFIFMYWPPVFEGDDEEYIPPSATYECILYFCVRDYIAEVVSGQYNETSTTSWPPPNETLKDAPWADSYAANDNTTHNGTLVLKPPGQDEAFTIDLYTLDLMRAWFGKFFTGYLSNQNVLSAGTSDVMQVFYDEMTTTIGPNQTLFGHSVPSVSPPMILLNRLCDAVSSHIRSVADPSTAVLGSSYVQQSVVEARWMWAIYPIALAVLTASFTGAAIVTSTIRGVPVWKSSALATLLHGLDERSCEVIGAATLAGAEDGAELWTMRVAEEGKRWLLRGDRPC